METAALFHRPTDNYAYACANGDLKLVLRTKKGDALKATLVHGDPFDWTEASPGNWEWNKSELAMTHSGSDSLFDYWTITVHPPYHRIRYAFQLYNDQESLFYCEKGIYDEPLKDNGYYFCFPFVHTSDATDVPKWVENTIWYQIFPERFANGNHNNNPEGTLEWGSEDPSPTNFFGGDLEGVLQNLDYLENLGVNGIYFTPIFKATSNHKYDTIDYFEIDPQFGTKETFKKLVDECHKRGIRIMLDAVFNHSGYYFPHFQDVLEKGEKSAYKDWFHIREFPIVQEPRPNYDTFAFTPFMPKLNTQHPEVKKYLLDVARYWVEEFDIDGWRLDVANEIDHQFWREFRAAVKEIKPDLYILGEIWHDSIAWLRGDQFDSVMNYPFQTNVLDLFARKTITPKKFMENMTTVSYLYPETINKGLFNLVGSHDTPRILTECGEDKELTKLIFTLMLTYPGTPCIYYGDEVALTGGMDPGCRKCMPWDPTEQDQDMLAHIQSMIELRTKEPLLANEGSLSWQYDAEAISFKKSTENKEVFVIINPSDKSKTVELLSGLSSPNTWKDAMNQTVVFKDTNKNRIDIPAKQFMILIVQ
ncbi:alpha-glycosidase [Bacillus carboniphilus]|uniref:Alpha-glycosidase n=1 Tax=Bacillus carboniphilus TaxID=86663 RepID=A0ABN0VQ74_9BACI